MHRRHIEVTALTPASAATVYDLLVDGPSWPRWSPIESFELERPGDPAPEGVGAIRVFRLGRTTGRDQILERVPNARFTYSSLSGLPVRDYVGAVELTGTVGGGTGIHWESRFFPSVRGTGWIVERSICRFLQRCADGLAEYAGTVPAEIGKTSSENTGTNTRGAGA